MKLSDHIKTITDQQEVVTLEIASLLECGTMSHLHLPIVVLSPTPVWLLVELVRAMVLDLAHLAMAE